MQDLIKKIKILCQERGWDQLNTPENLAKSIAIEAGELLECFQWGREYNLEEVKDELANVFNYCLQMADYLKLDPQKIILEKMEKTKKKYPLLSEKQVS